MSYIPAVALLTDSVSLPTIPSMEPVGKPSLDEVLEYAQDQADKFIRNHAAHLPSEQKEEIKQNALLRAWQAHGRIDRETWKAYIQRQAKGAVQDYLREGKGFKETRWDDPAEDDAETESVDGCESDLEAQGEAGAPARGRAPTEPKKFKQRLSHRLSVVSSEDNRALDAEEVAGICGIFTEANQFDKVKIRWELVARMAAVDPDLHLVAKLVRGFTETELAPGFGVTREMLSQRFYGFIEKLDSPEFYHSPWIAQTIYALGLSEEYGMPAVDNGLGWNNEPIDLDSRESLSLMGLFHQPEFQF